MHWCFKNCFFISIFSFQKRQCCAPIKTKSYSNDFLVAYCVDVEKNLHHPVLSKEKAVLRSVRIRLKEANIRGTVMTILNQVGLPTGYVDKIPKQSDQSPKVPNFIIGIFFLLLFFTLNNISSRSVRFLKVITYYISMSKCNVIWY